MDRIELQPGMRVRCVDAWPDRLKVGDEYTVDRLQRRAHETFVYVTGIYGGWLVDRFKPIVRVKAPTVYICPVIG